MKVRRSKKVMENYVCPNCWHQIQDCTCEHYPPWDLVMIDVNIQDVVRILNEKGYQTVSCCESHFDDNCYLYVAFPMKYDLELPEGFEYKKGACSIAYGFKKKEREDIELYNKVKAEKLKTLLEWAEALPKNPMKFQR